MSDLDPIVKLAGRSPYLRIRFDIHDNRFNR